MTKNTFTFTPERIKKANQIIAKYPKGKQRSAVMPLLYLAQEQQKGRYLTKEAINYIADFLGMHKIQVYEVASFYTMYNQKPVGKYLVQICRTTPCWIRGSDKITDACKRKLNIDIGEITEDKLFSLMEVECLGACINAPVIQVNNDYYENLDENQVIDIIDKLKADEEKG